MKYKYCDATWRPYLLMPTILVGSCVWTLIILRWAVLSSIIRHHRSTILVDHYPIIVQTNKISCRYAHIHSMSFSFNKRVQWFLKKKLKMKEGDRQTGRCSPTKHKKRDWYCSAGERKQIHYWCILKNGNEHKLCTGMSQFFSIYLYHTKTERKKVNKI